MKNRYIYSILVYLLVLLTAFSCSKDPIPLTPKKRTLLVYIALNNSLSGEIQDIHNALKEGWDSKMGSLVILSHSKGDSSPMLIKLKEQNGKIVAETLRTYPNMSSASPELLRKVISDTQLIAPGTSYGMLLFSHASGWLPEKAYQNPAWLGDPIQSGQVISRSIFEDNGSEMELADFAAAIPDGKFEFIASEMCFMSSVETTYALRKKAKYILASAPEMLSPGFTPIYKTSLGLLYKPQADLEGFGQAFFDYFNGLQGDYRSAVISLVRTSEMESLAALTREINPQLTQEQVDKVQFYDRFGSPHVFFDFRDYIAQAATPKQLEKMDLLLEKTVIFKRNTPKLINIIIARHSGFSVYIPQERLTRLNEAYKQTEWAKAVRN